MLFERANRLLRKAMFIFWGIVIGIGVVVNVGSRTARSLSGKSSVHPEGPPSHGRLSPVGRIWNLVRAYMLLPATFNKTCHTHSWFGTIPPRAETAIISAYVAINVILCAVAYSATDQNLYWESHSLQMWRIFSDRTGYLSYANFAIFFVFGIRNNILIWMTGWSFATFNRFHRWTARIATLQAILHSIGYTADTFLDGGLESYKLSWKEEYW